MRMGPDHVRRVRLMHSSAPNLQLLLLCDLFQIQIKQLPQVGVAFHQTGNIAKVLELLALSSFRVAPRFDISAQCVLQRCNPHENPVYVRGNNKFNVLSDHGFSRPVIDSHASDRAPCKVCSLETIATRMRIDQAHDIVCATCRLPVIKLFGGHAVILDYAFFMLNDEESLRRAADAKSRVALNSGGSQGAANDYVPYGPLMEKRQLRGANMMETATEFKNGMTGVR